MSSTRIVLLVALCAWTALPGRAEADEPVDSSLVERSQVRLVRQPVVLQERSPGACDDLTPDRIRLLEDGAPVEITHVEQTHLDGVHAILLDSSRAMLDSLQASKSAARRYIESLPPNELALLASFDDDLILHSPLSTDRERLADDLIWVETGWGSNLWDATDQMIRFLRSRPERKVLVLLTDGCDTQGDSDARPQEIVELAARTSSLVVFPIVIESPSRCEGSRNTFDSLTAIAGETGGLLHKLETIRDLDRILPELRRRLESERYVTYRPAPFGSGPKDKPEAQSARWRKLEVRPSGGKGCRIALSGPSRRLETATRGTFSGDEREKVDRVIRPFELGDSRWLASGTIRDVVRESGPLLASEPGMVAQYVDSPKRLTEERRVTALLPPLERVLRPGSHPTDVMIDALGLAGGIPGFEGSTGEDAGWTDAPFLVHGRSLLEIRESLARAMFDHPDYRHWAYAKIRAERLAALDDLVARGGDTIDPSQVRALKSLLAGEDWTPEPHELERFLAAWLGDLPAVELYTGVEWRFGQTVAAMSDRDAAAAFTADAEALWAHLPVWLPLPREVRLLGILVPGYDPDRQVLGFYRAVLPRPESFLGTWEFSSAAPLGLRLMNWLLDDDTLARIVRERFSIQGVSYRQLLGKNFGELLSRETLDDLKRKFGWRRGRLVSVGLGRRDLRGARVVVSAFYATESPDVGTPPAEQFCILLPRTPAEDSEEKRFFDALVEAKSSSPVPCILRYR